MEETWAASAAGNNTENMLTGGVTGEPTTHGLVYTADWTS